MTQPDRGRGRGRVLSPCPVALAAERAQVPLLRPERVGTDEAVEWLRQHTPDLGVVVAFGQFLPRSIRELPRLGFLLNAHASLLPRYRGAAPIARAILAGESKTGISIMRVEREMDAGPVALARETDIGSDENLGSLEGRLAELAADAMEQAVELAAADRLVWSEQDAARATLAPKIEREDSRLDWSQSTRDLVLQVRAMAPRPGASTLLDGESLRVLAARAVESAAERGATRPPGTVRREGDSVEVATGDGWLSLTVIQRAGGRAMDVASFLRGKDVPDGTRLGGAPEAG